jgi:hypothetical protein
MRRLLAALILVPLALLLVALAVANRKAVTLGLNPLDSTAGFGVEAPLFLFLFGAFALGLVVGGFATWLGQSEWRLMARTQAREATSWRRQAERLEKELESSDPRPKRIRIAAD